MKFKYVGPNEISMDDNGRMIERPAKTYGGENVLNGETIELDEFFSEKAMKNPDYELVKSSPKPKAKPKPKAQPKADPEVEVILAS